MAGMMNFVGARNGVKQERDATFDDLKVPVPGENGGSKKRRKSNPHVPTEPSQNVPRTLHDTDASDVETTTAAESAVLDDPYQQQDTQYYQGRPTDAPPARLVDADGDEVEPYSTDASDDADVEQEALKHSPQDESQSKPDGRRLGPIDGDSYPETTSGRPSITDMDDQREPLAEAYPAAHIAPTRIRQERVTGTRLAQASHPKQNLPRGQSKPQDLPERRHTAAAPVRNEQLSNVASHGFVSGPNGAPTNHAVTGPTPVSQQQSNRSMPASTIHHGHPNLSTQVPVREVRRQEATRPVSEPRSDVRALQQQTIRNQQARAQPQQHRGRGNQAPPAHTTEASEGGMSEVDDTNDSSRTQRESSVEPHQRDQEAIHLDHYPPELYKIPFQELKAASFDLDPNAAEPSILDSFQPEDALSEKMNALLSMDAGAKEEYFTSLDIEEWEEAGDWFLTSFSQLIDRFKVARQEKRKIARGFEDEVETRFESVTKKRKLIAAAMEEMKESGGRVLQSTPKKTTTQKVR